MPVRGYEEIDRGDVNFCISCGAELKKNDIQKAQSHGDDWVVRCSSCEMQVITIAGGAHIMPAEFEGDD